MEMGHFRIQGAPQFRQFHRLGRSGHEAASGFRDRLGRRADRNTLSGRDLSQPLIPIIYTDYGDESDPGPFPIPLTAPIEGGDSSTGDRHVITVDKDRKILCELYNAFPVTDHWEASSGAKFDLTVNQDRPLGWTSADAAGLPIFPGLVRYEEVYYNGRG